MNDKVLYIKEELNKKCLLEYKVIRSNRIENKWRSICEVKEDEQISIISDAMFKTMLNNEKRLKFPCKLLSTILDISYEELLENLILVKNEFDKDSIESKGERGDFLAKIGENYISIEMNVRDTLDRNIEYLDRVSRSKVKIGSQYVYPASIQINLNNFHFENHNRVIEVYKLQNNEGEMLNFKVFIQIYLPLLLKKRYNKIKEPLSELEKCILVMIETDRKKVKELAHGDMVLEEYMEEAKMAEKNDNYLREAYNHEQAIIDNAFEDGAEQERKSVIQKMLSKGFTAQEIADMLDISIEEIES